MHNMTAIMENTHSTDQHNLKQILDNFPDSIFTINTELEVKYVNPAFCKLLGYTEEELIGSQITTYLGDLGILEACALEVAEKGYCNDQETIFIRKDGSMVHISKNVQAIFDEAGNCTGNLVSIRDMTNLHYLNKELEASSRELELYTQRLEETVNELRNTQNQLVEAEKLASLGSLVAGVAHEINTPLGISITSASSMHEELAALSNQFNLNELKRSDLEQFFEHSDHACSILQTNLNRAADLVRNFKQVAIDQSVEEQRDINLHDYCDEAIISLAPKIKFSGVTITNQIDKNLILSINPGTVYQILSNLVLNSLTHAYEPGQKGNIIIAANMKNNDLHLEYSDDGKGIPEEDINKIFDPFFTTQRGRGGTGLGLSIVYNTVSGKLHGTIQVESKIDRGTRFSIDFPANQTTPN